MQKVSSGSVWQRIKGHAKAQFNMGVAYLNGKGVRTNKGTAGIKSHVQMGTRRHAMF